MQPFEIIMSPFEVYVAPVGTPFPNADAAPGASWKLLGVNGKRNQSEDGVTISHAQTIVQHRTAGSTGPVKAVRTEENFTASFVLEDLTPETYALALNGAPVSEIAAAAGIPGSRSVNLHQGTEVRTFAWLFRGPSSLLDGGNGQFKIPVAFQGGNPAPKFSKGDAAGLAFEVTALEDPNATSDEERFGSFEAQDAVAL